MIKIDTDGVTHVSKEGVETKVPLDKWITKLNDQQELCILPDGVKCVISRGKYRVMIHQSPPALRNLKWIAPDSKARYGPGTKYNNVILALPYVITVAAFEPRPNAKGHILSQWNECFFRSSSITSLDDELCYPGLLNCSKWPAGSGREKSAWICTQKLDYNKLNAEESHDKRTIKGLNALLSCLFDSGFNYSSEEHEGNSWYSATKDNDTRISTVENWVRESAKNPLFVLDVPWIPNGQSLKQVVDRVFQFSGAPAIKKTRLEDLERIVTNIK